ncbi:MAG: fructose-1,6-bisphosphatase, partial [Planctomycetes bacterium]|nr:fructose-1,6-bisphosphatase [Planctomycetota bacterium]
MTTKLTLTAIKADIGGYVGHTAVHPEVAQTCRRRLEAARGKGLLLDFEVGAVGDDQHFLRCLSIQLRSRQFLVGRTPDVAADAQHGLEGRPA